MPFPEFALARQPNLEAALSHFRALMQKDDSPIRAILHQPARAADYVAIPESAHPKLREALIRRNMPQFYTHQAETYELTKSGRNVVVVTPTASGKTLCYNLPVLDL
jgi:DEAD/DEAH box helicase domain-containing protein